MHRRWHPVDEPVAERVPQPINPVLRRVVACVVAWTLLPSHAAHALGTVHDQPPSPSTSTGTDDGNMNEVWEWVRQGDARFEVADFDGAIAAYERALARLSQAPGWASQTNLVRKLMSDAVLGRYRMHNNFDDLRRARELLAAYAEALPADSSDRAAAQAKVAEIDAEIEKAAPRRASGRTEYREMSEIQDQRREIARKLRQEHLLEASRTGKWAIGSWALAGAGIVALSVALPYALVRRHDARLYRRQKYLTLDAYNRAVAELDRIYDNVDRANTIALIGGIGAGVFAAAGTTLLVLRSRALKKANKVGVDVAWTGRQWTLGVHGRF